MRKNNELRLSFLGVSISLIINQPAIFKKGISLYSPYISTKKPDITINVNYADPVKYISKGKLVYQTDQWTLKKENNSFFFSCFGEYPAAAHFELDLNTKPVDFFSLDEEGHVLFFAFLPWVALGRLLNKRLAVMIHSSGVIEKGKSYLFVGPSGSGKTTIASLRGSNRVLLEDSYIVIKKNNSRFEMLPHPWGKNRVKLVSQDGVIVNKIFFVEHGKKNFIIPIDGVIALKKLMKENLFYNFWDNGAIEKSLDFCTELLGKVRCYRLGFVPNESVWNFLSSYFKA